MTNQQPAAKLEHPSVRTSPKWRHPRERTGVRFVLTNVTDPSRADDYSAWYDDYESAIIPPRRDRKRVSVRKPRRRRDCGRPALRGALRHRHSRSGVGRPTIENSPEYPRHLFAD